MARTGKWPARIALAVSAAMMASLFTVINAAGQSGPGEGLPTVGIEVQSADNAQVTYAIVVRNQGSAQSTAVTVRSNVPSNTTFESSNPPPTPTTSPSPGAPSCDNGGTREDAGRTCQWSLGTVPAGETRQITAVYNLDQSNVATYNVSISATVTDGEQHSNSDTDASLSRARQSIDHDTWVNDDEPPNWNHGNCPNLRVHQNNRVTTFLQANTLPTESSIERAWGALLQAQVQTTSYTQGAPGSIGAHRITSGEWTEGGSDAATSQNCPGAASTTTTDARTGGEPQSAQGATGTAVINGFPQFASWNVTSDLDDATERAAANNNGWELKDVIGAGDNFTRFHSSEAAAEQQPRLFIVYTTQEAATCVDADPETDTNAFGTEHIITAFVTDGVKVTDPQAGDACNGGPAVDTVTWEIEEDTPDAYISSQEGAPITKTVQNGDAGPNTIQTIADDGTTNIGIRQDEPVAGNNRVEARIVEDDGDPTTEPDNDPDPGGDSPPICAADPPAGVNCTGETDQHDDVIKEWSASASGGSSSSSAGGSSSTSPSGSGSSTSPTSSGSTSPSGSSSTSGSPSGTTSRPPSGSSSSSSSAGESPRQVTLFASSNEVVYPGSVTLSGQIVSNDNSCDDADEFVRLQRRVLGESEFENFQAMNTDSQGGFEFTVPAEESAEYLALAPRHDNCAEATSSGETVLVKVKITGRAGRRRVERRSNVGIVGRVQPDHDGTEVVLQRKRGGRWVKLREAELNGRSRYRFVLRANWRGRRVFRVVWLSQDAEHERNQTRRIVIRTKRPQ